MGSASSVPIEFQSEFQYGKKWRDIYETDCRPKIEAGIMKENECFEYLRKNIGSLDDLCNKTLNMNRIDERSDNKINNSQFTFKEEKSSCKKSDNDDKSLDRRRSRKLSLVPAYIDFENAQEELMIGAVVQSRSKINNEMVEGVIIEVNDEEDKVTVDYGVITEVFNGCDCVLIKSPLDFEIGDHVKVSPSGGHLFFNGVVININSDNTLNILMEGDEDSLEEDIEYNINKYYCQKIWSSRKISHNNLRDYCQSPIEF